MSTAWITKTKCFTTSRFLEKREFIQPFKLYGGRLFHTKVMRDEEQMIGCRKHDLYSYTDMMTDLNLQISLRR